MGTDAESGGITSEGVNIMSIINNVIHGECIEVMRGMEAESVDLVLTDPPYGIDFVSNRSSVKEYRKANKSVDGILNDGKDNASFLSEVIDELNRVMKDDSHIYWFTRWDKVPEQLPLLERYFNVKNAIIWKKNNWSMGDLQGAYAGQYEVILFAQKGRRILNEVDGKRRHPDILSYDRIPPSRLRHSHEKPEELIEFLMRKSSDVGDVVLDPFAGSGTTAAIAKRLGRDFITIELDEDYVGITRERVSNTCEGQAKE